jgi:hypothetical protein
MLNEASRVQVREAIRAFGVADRMRDAHPLDQGTCVQSTAKT